MGWRRYEVFRISTEVKMLGNHFVKEFQSHLSTVSVTDMKTSDLQMYVVVTRSRVSSGSIVSDYGLDDRENELRSPVRAKDFSCILCVQTGSGAHPASCTMGTGGLFPGGKARPGRDADHSPLSSAEVVNKYELYLLSTQTPPWRVEGLLYFILLLLTGYCHGVVSYKASQATANIY
jgi:hypothetical protein